MAIVIMTVTTTTTTKRDTGSQLQLMSEPVASDRRRRARTDAVSTPAL